jgi:hypothetical protein
MILNSAPQNEAILSNVGAIGEFRIRNSAKAFSILSSGLYANKIKAIIRELSCNAVDSHIDAGKQGTPFDVHLPNQLEPWFAIRDYGTGLTHEQVQNIYTTYFESTKTHSNDFTGALGLGSKSPFAYTDNFTVAAIKDGKRGVYSAFINEQGVPSIALMMSEETTDPAGVEVKFSVNDRYDFNKFVQEAQAVYRHFKLLPVVSGSSNFSFSPPTYEDKDICPGVSTTKRAYGTSGSVAVMGNIAYPIDIPSSDTILYESHRSMLRSSLEIHFAIGELDFQASREGLSYIPQTVNAIKTKLDELAAALSVRVAADANVIKNMWERTLYLQAKHSQDLWTGAVVKYVNDTKFPLMAATQNYGMRPVNQEIDVDILAKKYNIVIRAFSKNRHAKVASNVKPSSRYIKATSLSKETVVLHWNFGIANDVFFVENDTKVGALQRAKYHWRQKPRAEITYTDNVYVMEKADKSKDMNVKAFLKFLHNPPAKQVMVASTLLTPVREKQDRAKNVTIMKLERVYRRHRDDSPTWTDCGKAADFDTKKTHYYLPLCGFAMITETEYTSAKDLFTDLNQSGVPGLMKIDIYGVRKGDMSFIKTQKNWVNLEDVIRKTLATLGDDFRTGLAMATLDHYSLLRYNGAVVSLLTDKTGLFTKFAERIRNVQKVSYSEYNLNRLAKRFAPTLDFNVVTLKTNLSKDCQEVYKRYPLMKSISYSTQDHAALAQYINLIDAHFAQKD